MGETTRKTVCLLPCRRCGATVEFGGIDNGVAYLYHDCVLEVELKSYDTDTAVIAAFWNAANALPVEEQTPDDEAPRKVTPELRKAISDIVQCWGWLASYRWQHRKYFGRFSEAQRAWFTTQYPTWYQWECVAGYPDEAAYSLEQIQWVGQLAEMIA